MSSITPPPPPPTDPPAGEILDSHQGSAIAPGSSGQGGRGGKGLKRGLLIGGGVLGLAVVGGGAWAAMSFFATGAQPSEALPAGTLGYASIDLDPGGSQKIEALQTLNKFPAFKDKVSVSGGGGDLRESIFEAITKDAPCKGLTFKDVDSWLGDRAAVAAVKDANGKVQPVVVLQVKDADAADKGLEKIKACSTDESDKDTGWSIEGDWAVVAETKAEAQAVTQAADKANLADDETYQKWTGETGDAGIATFYAAPGAAQAVLDEMGDDSGSIPEQFTSQLKDFKGAAATIRFADDTLELEAAAATPKDAASAFGTGSVADRVGDLPDDTAAVLGASLGKDWFQKVLDQYSAVLGGDDSGAFLDQVEQATGLDLPTDIDTLTEDGIVVTVGPGLDPETLANAADPSAVPIAISLHGDADKIQAVVTKIQAAVPGGTEILGTSVDGETVVIGPDAAYRDSVTKGGKLGDTDLFKQVIPNADSPGVFFVNLNSFDKAIASLGDDEVTDNVKPLSAIGFSSSVKGDATHITIRVGTDK